MRGHVAEAFRRKEMADENIRLQQQLHIANLALASTNQELDKLLKQQEERIETDEISLQITHESLENLPLPIIGIDDTNIIVLINAAAQQLLEHSDPLLGVPMEHGIPLLSHAWSRVTTEIVIKDISYKAVTHPMGSNSRSKGTLMTLIKVS